MLGRNSQYSIVSKKITKRFIQDEMQTFKYLGLNVMQLSGFISMDQNLYTNESEEKNISKEGRMDKRLQLNEDEAQQFCGLAQQLNWVSVK